MGKLILKEIEQKKTRRHKFGKDKIYFQDYDNLYPNRVKALIENSPTAFRSAQMMAKYIIGKGLVNEDLQMERKKAKHLPAMSVDQY